MMAMLPTRWFGVGLPRGRPSMACALRPNPCACVHSGSVRHFRLASVSRSRSSSCSFIPSSHRHDPLRSREAGNRVRASSSSSSSSSSETMEEVAVPNPEVIIDNMADAGATIVTVRFGNYLEDLVDTCAALRALDLNVVRAKLCDETNRNTFYITNLADGEKVTKADKLEEIRMTILTNMMEFHPESKEKLILGVAHMPKASTVLESMEQNPLGPRPSSLIPTKISCKEHPSGSRTELTVETTDRPGLLTDIVKLLKDISVNVMSAEIDTVGLMAHDVLYVSYHGAALDDNMMELVRNVLQYYLSKAEVSKEESY